MELLDFYACVISGSERHSGFQDLVGCVGKAIGISIPGFLMRQGVLVRERSGTKARISANLRESMD